MKIIPITTTCLAILLIALPQSANAQSLPAVFVLGEQEAAYEKLCEQHSRTLLAASNNDMDQALKNWFELLQAIDKHAQTINYDIKGLKVWLHVFWNPDGSISNIGFFMMPNSRNFKPEEIKALFSSFMRQYKSSFKSDKPFSHYTSANFPAFIQRKG